MEFIEMYEMTQNEILRSKVRMAGIVAATAILGDPGRAEEHPFCRLVIREPMSAYWLDQLMFSVVADVNITEESADNDIQNRVNSVFPNHALANTNV